VPDPATTGPPEASAPVFPWEAPSADTGPAPGVAFAPHGPRLVAYLLDTLVIALLMIGLLAVVAVIGRAAYDTDMLAPPAVRAEPGAAALVWLFGGAALVVVLGYFPFFWARSGRTPGMRPFRLWIVRDRDGMPISARTAILRWIGLYVAGSVFYLGFVWIFIDKRRRGWHDLIAGTVVIQSPHGRTST
jgi:uncharacterized RDD family membrane protein YckC